MKPLLRFTIVVTCIILISTLAIAQKKERISIPEGSKVYIAKMENGFDGYISAEIIKRKLPVTIVTDDSTADYIITGGSNKGDHHWYDTVVTGVEKDRNQGNIQLVSAKEKSVIWAAEAGDRSLWWGSLKKSGPRKVAERLVGKMKDELFKK